MNMIIITASLFILIQVFLLLSFFIFYIKMLNKIDLKNFSNINNFKEIKQELNNIKIELEIKSNKKIKRRVGDKNDK